MSIVNTDNLKSILLNFKEKVNNKILYTEALETSTETQYDIELKNVNIEDIITLIILPNISCGDSPSIKINDNDPIYIKNSENNNLSANDIKENIPFTLVRVGSNFFIRSSITSNTVNTLNIYQQLDEPSEKEGLWIKDDQCNKYNNIEETGTDSYYSSDNDCQYTRLADIPYDFYYGSACAIGNDIYLLGGYGDAGSYYNYKYNINTNTYTKLTNVPYDFYCGGACAIGDDIYILGGKSNNKYNYKYNITTDTYTRLADIRYNLYCGCACAIGDDIYLLGSYNNRANYKYNINTNTYTQLTIIPYAFSYGSISTIADNIYILGGKSNNKYNYKYNITTDTYTRLADIPYSFYNGSACAIGNDIYLLGGDGDAGSYTYKYNINTNTYTKLINIPYTFKSGSVSLSDSIYLLGSYSKSYIRYNYKFGKLKFTPNTILFLNNYSSKYNSPYGIKLHNSLFSVLNRYYFNNVFMTDNNGYRYITDYYWGDGTNWNKI